MLLRQAVHNRAYRCSLVLERRDKRRPIRLIQTRRHRAMIASTRTANNRRTTKPPPKVEILEKPRSCEFSSPPSLIPVARSKVADQLTYQQLGHADNNRASTWSRVKCLPAVAEYLAEARTA